MDEQHAFEEIAYIKKIIEDSRKSIIYSGKEFIFWGILASIGMIGTEILEILHLYLNILWFWVIIIGIGWLFAIYNYFKEQKSRRIYSFAEKIVKVVWVGCGISMALIGFLGPYTRGLHYNYINSALAAILGSAYFITGFIIDSKLLRLLSFLWWLGSILMFLFFSAYNLWIMAGMMILFQVVPGIMFYKNSKKERSSAV
jgi:hypothetical protein